MIAWQRGGVGRGQESVTLIAYDAEGMAEAVETLFEAIAGMEPLTTWVWPAADALTPAKAADARPAFETQWIAHLPDRIEAIQVNGGELVAFSHDGSLTTLAAGGRIKSSRAVSGEAHRAGTAGSCGRPLGHRRRSVRSGPIAS